MRLVSDEGAWLGERQAREEKGAELIYARATELFESPIEGRFDLAHLKPVHAFPFQDLPYHRPGFVRSDTERWVKARSLEGQATSHVIPYAHDEIEARIRKILRGFGGPSLLNGLNGRPLPAAWRSCTVTWITRMRFMKATAGRYANSRARWPSPRVMTWIGRGRLSAPLNGTRCISHAMSRCWSEFIPG